MVVAVANDDEFLYLCFYPTTNQSVKQVLMQGISFWFNTDGKKDRDNGISYPLPFTTAKGGSNGTEDRKDRSMMRGNTDGRNEVSQVEKIVHNIKLRNGEVKISTENGVSEVPVPGLIGMEICMDAQNGVFAYEAKIPLNDPTASYSLGGEPGQDLMIGLRSDALDRDEIDESLAPDMNADMDGSAARGGGSRGSGGKGGSGKMGARSGGMKTSSELRFWANVKLAVNPEK